ILAGRSSVTTYQRADRSTLIGRPTTRPIAEIMGDGPPVPVATPVARYIEQWPAANDAVVVDGDRPAGVVRRADAERVAAASAEAAGPTTVGALVVAVPPAGPHWSMAEATTAMRAARVDAIPVADDEGRF